MNALRLSLILFAVLCLPQRAPAAELDLVRGVAAQPLKAQVKRVVEALSYLGEPLTAEQQEQLDAAIKEMDDDQAGAAIQAVLDPLCLAGVNINPESRVKVARGAARAQLNEQGWRVFLLKVHNEAGVTAPLGVHSSNAAPVYARSSNAAAPALRVKPEDVPDRWMDVQSFDNQPLNKTLSGLELEYRIIQLYSRDRGKREATLKFDVGQGTQDLGFRNELAILFDCQAAVKIEVEILDTDGTPTTGQFVIRDSHGQVYPARSRRLAPDFFFHDQKPYWHVERARIGSTRQVPVELIVNGQSVETKNINADGSIQEVTFEHVLERSSWVALRIFPSCHTNPVFVEVDGAPIRASQRSAKWCLDAIDVCWSQKEPRTRDEEKETAAAAYEQAREAYREILAGSFDDTTAQ